MISLVFIKFSNYAMQDLNGFIIEPLNLGVINSKDYVLTTNPPLDGNISIRRNKKPKKPADKKQTPKIRMEITGNEDILKINLYEVLISAR